MKKFSKTNKWKGRGKVVIMAVIDNKIYCTFSAGQSQECTSQHIPAHFSLFQSIPFNSIIPSSMSANLSIFQPIPSSSSLSFSIMFIDHMSPNIWLFVQCALYIISRVKTTTKNPTNQPTIYRAYPYLFNLFCSGRSREIWNSAKKNTVASGNRENAAWSAEGENCKGKLDKRFTDDLISKTMIAHPHLMLKIAISI